MRANIVERLERVGRRADDDDRVGADVVGQEVANLGNFLDATGVLPHLGPQPIAFRPRVLLGDKRFDRIGERLRQLFDTDIG